MSEKLRFRIERGDLGQAEIGVIEVLDPAVLGKRATITFEAFGEVKRSRGIDVARELGKSTVTLAQVTRVPLPDAVSRAYDYAGRDLHISFRVKARIDDGLLFKTEETFTVSNPWHRGTGSRQSDVEAQVEPADKFDFWRNFQALPHIARIKVLALGAAALIVAGGNMLVGAHDQFVPESRGWFYDQTGSKGKSESPLMKALLGSGTVGGILWFAIRRQLRRYMTLELRAPSRIDPHTRLRARDLIRGVPHVAITHARVRVVAYNRERGRYRERSGKNDTTKSFAHPVRSLVLYEAEIHHAPPRRPIEEQLFDDIDFAGVFEHLLPPLELDTSTGIDLHWELQFLHADFVDQEIVGPSAVFDIDAFYRRVEPTS